MLEKEIENHLEWAVERMGGKSWKFTSPGRKGVADRVVCLPDGSTWFIELKRPKGGVLSPLQAQFQSEVVWLKQKYALLHTKELIDEWRRTYEPVPTRHTAQHNDKVSEVGRSAIKERMGRADG